MDGTSTKDDALSGMVDILSLAMDNTSFSSTTKPTATFELFSQFPAEIQWCVFEQLLDLEGLGRGPAVHFLTGFPRTLAKALFSSDPDERMDTGLRHNFAQGIDFVTHDTMSLLGSFKRTDRRGREYIPNAIPHHIRLPQIAQTCSLATRVVRTHQQNKTPVGLHGGRSILVNEEDDLFYFDILVLSKKPRSDRVLHLRSANTINEELTDCLISPVPMVHGADLLKGVRRLAVPGWVSKLTDGGCLGWHFQPKRQRDLVDYIDSSCSESDSEDYDSSDWLKKVPCDRCGRVMGGHFKVTWPEEYVLLAAAWLPALQSIHYVVRNEIPPPGSLGSDYAPWRALAGPSPQEPALVFGDSWVTTATAMYRHRGNRKSSRFSTVGAEPPQTFQSIGGSLVELFAPIDFHVLLHAFVTVPFFDLDWAASFPMDSQLLKVWKDKIPHLSFRYLRWVPEGSDLLPWKTDLKPHGTPKKRRQ
ncbi:uncharacterized protein PODANS_6_7620 [Podospora anserina S mat+]|uniref:Podospora anserina S mat+ genomic DNA chromosome 6, supercontig 2 n=1 Tax=Podospora anserina (strain S / ATCC MYA-4624 / DSM 980 / FGSC 10383) TaxID=515849 RepID=B2B3Y4_PODAN|nr:uncharacterized protein PODANS_6_7620 [Podospora anserina S mat+]CAP71820.1 unnamed protein product [Podospora anserina S mat+]CDP31211.1 Putative protein of unknown function [Podospora anserina S mat+]